MTVKTEQRTCPEHGEFQASCLFGNHWTGCPQCAQMVEERRARREAEQARVYRERAIQGHLDRSGIAPRFVDGFAAFKARTPAQRAALAACRSFADGFMEDQGVGMFLLGPPGTGKTLLASGIVRAVIEAHALRAEIATARAVVRRLRANWARGADETEAAVLEDLAGVALLVVDELCDTSDAEVAQLFGVINSRYERLAPTIVVSNFTPLLVKQALGDRSFDRLAEGAATIVCDWPSHRAGSAA